MEEPQKPQANKPNIFVILALVGAVLAVVGVARLTSEVNDLTKKVEGINQSGAKQAAEKTQSPNDPITTTITSGKGGFSMTVPNGWGPLYNATNGDYMFIVGQGQPTLAPSAKTVVNRVEAGGSDSAYVFSISIFDKATDVAPPQGTAEEFTIGKEDGLTGKKFTYRYAEDALAGIGYQRYQGDRDYTYSFTTKSGKQLVVNYSVYGQDPRNYSEQVDEIVRSIVVK